MQISNNSVNFKGNIYQFPLDYKSSLAYQDSAEPAVDIEDEQAEEQKLLASLDALAASATFKNGRALTSQGFPYTGPLTMTVGDDKQIDMKFRDGYIQSSDIDGEYRKIYIPLRKTPRNKGVEIRTFDSSNSFVQDDVHFYDESGKVKRCVQVKSGQKMQALDFENGKIAAKTIYNGGKIESATIKDKDGEIVRIIEKYPQDSPNDYIISDFNPDSSLINRVGRINQSFKTPAKDVDIQGAPKYISYDGDDCFWELKNDSSEDDLNIDYERIENGEKTAIRIYSPFEDGQGGFIEVTKPDGRKILIEEDSKGGLSYLGHMPRQDFRYIRKEIMELMDLCDKHGIKTE